MQSLNSFVNVARTECLSCLKFDIKGVNSSFNKSLQLLAILKVLLAHIGSDELLPSSNVRRVLCVVQHVSSAKASNHIFSKTARPRALIQ